MATKWNFVVLVSLEFWMANNGDVAADHITLTLDCAAAGKHVGGYHHSRCVQCGRLYRCSKRSRHLGGMSFSMGFQHFGAADPMRRCSGHIYVLKQCLRE